MITVLHVITGLREAGAEQALARLVIGLDRSRFRCVVAVLRDGGPWRGALEAAGIEVIPLALNKTSDSLIGLQRLVGAWRRVRPQVVQSWLYHADLLATLASNLAPSARLVWTLRNSDLSGSARSDWNILTASLASLSRRPDVIVSNSHAGLAAHRALGYRPRDACVIPNGVDLDVFRPASAEERSAARARLGLPSEPFIIGMAARYDPAKRHADFLAAARIAKDSGFGGLFVLAGRGVDASNDALVQAIASAGLSEGVRLIGTQSDMPAFYAALDLATLTSIRGEGFPNVIAEAMACALPVVATDSGDERVITRNVGTVVPAGARADIADAWLRIAALTQSERAELGASARARIAKAYPLAASIRAYEQLYEELVRSAQKRSPLG
jgi:glycosyltransferase involved in cell wall biosynthesis